MKVGDVVRLNSGGPQMTVNQLFDASNVECYWFDDCDNHMSGTFAQGALMINES